MNCATRGLETYVPSPDIPWDAGRVQHLYRRMGFGARPDEIELALTEGPDATVTRLLAQATDRPYYPAPEWAYYNYDALAANGIDQFDAFMELNRGYIEEATTYGVREKLALFWQNHLVTVYETHSCPSYHYQYLRVIEEYGTGNFKDLIREMTVTPAMLFYLNGFENTRENPNENYARELFELFTLGENNGYTQEDIVEASRALTGYNGWTSYCGNVNWAPWGFDPGEKTIFGVTANFNYGTLINLLFEQRGELIARFICGKLYRYYVHRETNEAIVNELAQTFLDNDFEIQPVLEQLFRSAHFFEDSNVGVLIKSPMELMIGYTRQGNFGDFENRIDWGFWAAANMGQYLGHPTDVAGWKGDRSWIDSNRITLRWEFLDGFAWAVHNESEDTYRNFGKLLTGESRDPETISRAVIDYYIPKGLVSEDAYATAVDVLRWDVPSNYYDDGSWSLDWPTASWQMVLLIRYVGRLPEFQLN